MALFHQQQKRYLAYGACGAVWVATIVVLWFAAVSDARPKQLLACSLTSYLACWAAFFALSGRARRGNVMRFIACNLSGLLTVAVLELCAISGAIDYRPLFGRPPQPWESKHNRLDRELLHIHRPHVHSKGHFKGGGLVRLGAPALSVQRYDVKYDRNGFRNEKDQEKSDCIVIGDSFVEAGGVLADQLFTKHLANSHKVTVANLGQAHYGPQQELKVLERFGVGLLPAVCVWVFFEGNDFADVWRYQEVSGTWPDSLSSSWQDRTFTKNSLRWLSAKLTTSANDRSGIFESIDGPRRLWFGYAGKPLSMRDAAALKITTAVLEKAHALCEQKGIRLVVAFAPTKFRVYADICSFDTGRSDDLANLTIADWSVNDLPDRLAESLRAVSSDIAFLDLTTALKSAAEQGLLVYYQDDTHWSPAGHEVVGHAIATYLEANGPRIAGTRQE